MAHLEIAGLTVGYGALTALDRLDLAIDGAEIFVLLGGSGSGKTTLLRALGGFIAPKAGRITLDGQDITHLPPHRRPVNTTFQSYALFPHMSVADNVGFGLRRQGAKATDIKARTAELLRLVGLEDMAHRRPDALSGGQRQRVALARALAPRPRLLLLDEPMSALDRGLREQTRQELLRVHRQTGTTFMLVTHDQDEALAMATRIGLLHQGRLEQVGTPTEIYERPATRYVAAFMGCSNIFPATMGGTEPHTMVVVNGLGLVQAAGPASAEQGTIHLGLRAECLRIGGAAVNRADGVVTGIAYRGDTVDIAVRLPGGLTLNTNQHLAMGAAGLPQPGAAVTVTWPAEACMLLAS